MKLLDVEFIDVKVMEVSFFICDGKYYNKWGFVVLVGVLI